MLFVSVPPNIVTIPVVQTRCLKTEFDSTYPVHLNGIIAQDEFQQSIANINRAVSSRTSLFSVFGIFIALFLLTGFILFAVGGFDAVNSRRSGFPPLVGVGFGLFGCSICGCFVLQSGRNRRVREAITAESIKYSSRSPTPCSWRLHSRTTWWTGPDNQQRASTNFCIIIEIDHSFPSQDAHKYQPSDQPPSYNSQVAGEHCSRCGTTNLNLMAKFCSSCGQPLNA